MNPDPEGGAIIPGEEDHQRVHATIMEEKEQ